MLSPPSSLLAFWVGDVLPAEVVVETALPAVPVVVVEVLVERELVDVRELVDEVRTEVVEAAVILK
jgi:hypothetical protein